jgi:integrase
MKGTIRATVKVGQIQRERRFVPSTPPRVIKAWKADTESKLRKRYPAASDRTAKAGTLKADAPRYLGMVRHLADWVTRRSEIRAWFPHLSDRARHTITREDVMRIRGAWKAAGIANRTCNNRVSALRDLFRKLDGDETPTPCDHVPFLKPPRTPIDRVSPETVNAVLENLWQRGRFTDARRGRPVNHALADRARLMVLASTGRRPCEVERTLPNDVNMQARVWGVRDAKGGWTSGIYLNDEMLIAWQAFIDAEAWGPIPGHFARRLREAGWPKGVRPYNLRHSLWIAASELGADLADIQAGAGHKHIATTRGSYVPVLASRMQKLSELTSGHFRWHPSAGTHAKTGVH